MKHKKYNLAFILGLILFVLFSCQKDDSDPDLLDQFNNLDGVTAKAVQLENDYPEHYQLDITQPVDHNNPNGPTFIQTIYLSHQDLSKPVVLNTLGYSTSVNGVGTIARLVDANNINVPHRYYEDAEISSTDFQYLTLEQAAADHHRIITLLKNVYKGKWLTTGGSKGGMTALFHKRFYPDDVDATVAVVAPLMKGFPDQRFYTFLNEVGTSGIRQQIKDFQRNVLTGRDSMKIFMQEYLDYIECTISMDYDMALEFSVLEYAFYYWQYHRESTAEIPDDNSTYREMFNHLNRVSSVYYYTDEDKQVSDNFYYQALTELGYYGFITHHLEDLLIHLDETSFRLLAPNGNNLQLDETIMEDIIQWLESYGDHIIYLYGAIDPYTIAAIETTSQTNSIKIVQDDMAHSISISGLDEKDLFYNTLEEWLDIEIVE